MEVFKYKGKELLFWRVTGEVISSSKYSETYVSSSGGGGYVGRYGGTISAPSISSTSVTQHEFWLRLSNNEELDVQLSGFDIPLRDGQKVSMVLVAGKEGVYGRYVALINHSAKNTGF